MKSILGRRVCKAENQLGKSRRRKSRTPTISRTVSESGCPKLFVLQCGDEFVGGNVCLPEQPRQCSNFDFRMHRDYAASITELYDNVASTLSDLFEPKSLERSQCLGARDVRKLRHAPGRRTL
jgi:hypothetical protein